MIWISLLNLAISTAVLVIVYRAHRVHRKAPAPTRVPARMPDTQSLRSMHAQIARGIPSDDPKRFRPDPTALYNVFRVDAEGHLALADEHRYSGMGTELAEEAVVAFNRDPSWTGTVYAYEGAALKYKASR